MDERMCALCGSKEGLAEVTIARKKMFVCESCFNDAIDANQESAGLEKESEWNDESKNKLFKDVSDTGRTRVINKDESLNWTQIFKIVNFIMLAVFVLAGIVFGVILFEDFLGDGGFFIGVLVGAVVGTLVGMAFVSFSMVIVEISQKLTAILEELKIANKKK